MEFLLPLAIVLVVLMGVPWLALHYITKWKSAATITRADEKLLDELYELARRLDERLGSIERIMTAENPDWRHPRLPRPSPRLDAELDRPRLTTEE